jgi:tight adherence protein B
MALIMLGFFSILVASFATILALTRRSPQEQIVAQRMALIHISTRKLEGSATEIAQLFKVTKIGHFGWLDEILAPYAFPQKLQLRILQANSSTTPATLILTSMGLSVAGYFVVWLFTSMILLDIGGGAALSLLPYGILALKRSRRVSAFNAVLAEAIDMLARALRAGHSVVSAMEMLSQNAQEPLASEFAEIFRQVNLGLPMRDALLLLLGRVPSSDLRVLVTAILVQKDTGGNLAEILDRTVFVIRERLRIQGEIQVQTAQGRLTGWILSSLPVVMMILLNLLNPGYSSILFNDPLGRKLMYISGGMLVAGTLIIRRMVNGIEV